MDSRLEKAGMQGGGEDYSVRLFSPLEGWFYDEEDFCKPLSGGALYGYHRQICRALKGDWIQEKEGGLAGYLPEGSLKEKVVRMHPSIEVWRCSAWGVLTVECTQVLSTSELAELKKEWQGQMNDGWGEAFAQQEIDVDIGCRLYVDFGAGSPDQIRTEQELKGCQVQEAWLEQEAPKMGMA